jgi:tripartite-type tricarboxylate transporter receptor subunit TctC
LRDPTDFPDWPTYRELGYDIVLGSLNGFAAPAGTPQEYVDILDNAVKDTFQDKGFLNAVKTVNMDLVLSYMNGKDFRQLLYKLQDDLRPVFKEFYEKK